MCQKSQENGNFYISKWELYFSNRLRVYYTYVKMHRKRGVYLYCKLWEKVFIQLKRKGGLFDNFALAWVPRGQKFHASAHNYE